MEIMNLEINILYFLCSPTAGRETSHRTGTITAKQLFEGFADIPAGSIREALHSMETDGLVTMDSTGTLLSVTENGILRLQSSLACQTHRFDSCRCGMAD